MLWGYGPKWAETLGPLLLQKLNLSWCVSQLKPEKLRKTVVMPFSDSHLNHYLPFSDFFPNDKYKVPFQDKICENKCKIRMKMCLTFDSSTCASRMRINNIHAANRWSDSEQSRVRARALAVGENGFRVDNNGDFDAIFSRADVKWKHGILRRMFSLKILAQKGDFWLISWPKNSTGLTGLPQCDLTGPIPKFTGPGPTTRA